MTFDTENIIVRFGLLSDLHISASDAGQENQKKFAAALRSFRKLTNDGKDLPLVLIAGDVIDWDGLSDIRYVQEAVSANLNAAQTKLLITPGNHDAWCTNEVETSSKYFMKKVFLDYNLFSDFLPAYTNFNTDLPKLEQIEGYQHIVQNGVHFLSVVGVDGDHGTTAIRWLTDQLDQLRSAGNKLPVFILTHVPASGTVVASTDGDSSSRWHSDSLRAALAAYPEAVVCSGHTHAPIDSANNVWQGAFTAINCGSLHLDEDGCKSGCAFVEVDKNGVIRYTRYLISDDEKLSVLSGDPLILSRPRERGDANNDGAVDLTDALLILRHANGKGDLDSAAVQRADVDGDGVLSNLDAGSIVVNELP